MKKATVHIFSPLHMSIILEMRMAKPALHKDESTSSPMRKSMSLKKNKQNQSKTKREAERPWCPIVLEFIIFHLDFFLFPVSQQTKVLCLFMLRLFHSWLKFAFGHRSYSACWIQDENPLNPECWFNSLPNPEPLIKIKTTNLKKKIQEIGNKWKTKRNRKTESEPVALLGGPTVV